MPGISLTQAEADRLIAVEKVRSDDLVYTYPAAGTPALTIPFRSADGQESFIVDLRRGRIKMTQVTHQLRGREAVVLVRVDLDGPTHENPDGTEIPCPHLHVYREGFADKWAHPLPGHGFTDPSDRQTTLREFLSFCRVVDPGVVKQGLFP